MKRTNPKNKPVGAGVSSEGSKDFVSEISEAYPGGTEEVFDIGEMKAVYPAGEEMDAPVQEGTGYRKEDIDEDGDEIPGIPGFPSMERWKDPEEPPPPQKSGGEDSEEDPQDGGESGQGQGEGEEGTTTPGGRKKVQKDSPLRSQGSLSDSPPEEGEGEGESWEEIEKMIRDYLDGHSSTSDGKLQEELQDPEKRKQYENWKRQFQEARNEAVKKHKPQIPWDQDEKAKKAGKPGGRFGKHGYGLGGELIQIGAIVKPDRLLWKRLLKKFISNRIASRVGSSWVRRDLRTRSVTKELTKRGQQTRFKARNVPAARQDRHKIGVLVDVSGSVFDKEIQGHLRDILLGVPKDKAEVLIWTFDDGIQDGPMSPEKYHPIKGGGGTDPWAAVKQAKEKNPGLDIWVFLTDGFFSAAPPGLINPKNTGFIIPEDGSTDSVPDGSTVLHPHGWRLSG